MSSQNILEKPKRVHTILMACRWAFLILFIWSISLWKQTQTLIDFIGILTCLHLLLSSYTLQLTYDREILEKIKENTDEIDRITKLFNSRPRHERRLIIKEMDKQ